MKARQKHRKEQIAAIVGGIIWGIAGFYVTARIYIHGPQAQSFVDGNELAMWFTKLLIIFLSSICLGALFGYGLYDWYIKRKSNRKSEENPRRGPHSEFVRDQKL